MDLGIISFVCMTALVIASLIALLTKSHKDASHQDARRLFLSPPLVGTTDPHRSGFWYTSNWFAGEKVNEAIMEGKAHYARKSRRHHSYGLRKRSSRHSR
jgi:hypothetical protein